MGGFAGGCSVFGNAPLDVIKTRMQGLEAKKYKTTLDCARQIMVKEGLKGFYKGTMPRLVRSILLTITRTAKGDKCPQFFGRYPP